MGLISDYVDFYADTEVPPIFNRWAIISVIGQLAGLRVFLKFANDKIKPTQYIMLMGLSGARKSQAISNAKRLAIAAGISRIAATKTTKEAFFAALEGESNEFAEFTDHSLGHEISIFAGEANDFFGINNYEFISAIGSLWSDDSFHYKPKHGPENKIINPAVSILAGNTPTNFAKAFPPDIVGQGFLSRLLLVHSDASEKQIAWPKVQEDISHFVSHLQLMQCECLGEMTFTPEAHDAITDIYKTWKGFDDPRFESYGARRLIHLFKVCMCVSLAKREMCMTMDTLIEANTLLSFTEQNMPRALGEFGRSLNAHVQNAVLLAVYSIFKKTCAGVELQDIWKAVASDITTRQQLTEIVCSLVTQEKLQVVNAKYYPKRDSIVDKLKGKYIDLSYLTKEELGQNGIYSGQIPT